MVFCLRGAVAAVTVPTDDCRCRVDYGTRRSRYHFAALVILSGLERFSAIDGEGHRSFGSVGSLDWCRFFTLALSLSLTGGGVETRR